MEEITKTDVVDEKIDEKIEVIDEKIDKATPIRREIKEILSKDLSKLRKNFIKYFTVGLDKKSDEYKATQKEYKTIFNILKDFLYYTKETETETRKYSDQLSVLFYRVAVASKFLMKLELDDHLQEVLTEQGLMVQAKDDIGLDEDALTVIKHMFNQACSIQSQICQNADEIKIEIYNELPEDIKYNKETNKTGVKNSDFNKFVNLTIKKEDNLEKARKNVDKITEDSEDDIERSKKITYISKKIVNINEGETDE